MHHSSGKHRFGYSTRNQFSEQSSQQSHQKASTGRIPRRGRLAGDDVIDVEFEDIESGARYVPRQPATQPPIVRPATVREPDFDDMAMHGADRLDVFSARKSAARAASGMSTAGFAAAIVVLSLAVFWFAGGYALAPGLFGAGSGSGLTLSSVSVDPALVRDGDFYVVQGVIRNESATDHDVPLLAIAPGESADGELPLYARAGKQRLAAGESTRFRVRVPNQVRDYGQLTVTLAGGGTAR